MGGGGTVFIPRFEHTEPIMGKSWDASFPLVRRVVQGARSVVSTGGSGIQRSNAEV